MIKLFNAKLILKTIENVSTDVFKIEAKIVDNTGNFLARDAKELDLIYLDNHVANSLYRYKITKIYPETSGADLVVDITWDMAGEEVQEPITDGDCVIGRRNAKGDTITLTSITTNLVGESLQAAIRNFEQSLIIDQVSEKESELSNPEQDGQVLASTVDGVRSWVTLPNVEDAINSVKDQPNGIPSLDENGKIPAAQIPSIAITNIFPVASETEMLKLGEQGAEKGDLATRTDDGTQYILIDNDPSKIENWKCLEKPCEIHSVNGKIGVVVLTTKDVAEDTNLYFTDERVEKSPAVVALKEALDAVPTDALLKSEYDKDNDGIIDVAKLAESVQYANVLGKPEFAAVATSGDYNDLLNKPEIPTLPELADVATSGNYTDLVGKPELKPIATSGSYNDLTDKPEIPVLPELATVATSGSYNDLADKPIIPVVPELANVATSGSYSDLTNKPELKPVATSGSYSDLTDKPAIPAKTSDLELDNVYTKEETDGKVNGLINDTASAKTTTYSSNKIDELVTAASGSGGASIVRYAVDGNVVLASGEGVTFTKTGNKVVVNCPEDVYIVSLSIHFSEEDMTGLTNCSVDFGSSAKYDGAGMNTTYQNMMPPIVQIVNDVDGNRAYRPATAYNYNTNSHTLQVTGLLNSVACWVRLAF